jgi:hypothetical protein
VTIWATKHPRLADDAPLSAFKSQYAFLRLPPWPGASEEQDRQRYIFCYNIQVLVNGAAIAAVVCLIGVVVLLFLTRQTPDAPWATELLSRWPLNASLRNAIVAHSLVDPASESASLNMSRLLTITSYANLVWFGWLLWRIYMEAKRRESFVDRPRMPYVYVGIFLFLLYYLWKGPSDSNFFYFPSFYDNTTILSIKESIYISIVYFVFGGTVFYASSECRKLLSRKLETDK